MTTRSGPERVVSQLSGRLAAAIKHALGGGGSRSARGAARAGLLFCALASGALWLGASPALAVQTHVFSSSFGSQGAGPGQVSNPQGVAVNQVTGNVYVADTGNARVDEFSSSGTFIRAWGWGVLDGASSFETCTTTCQAGVSGSGAGQFTSPAFIAVDNSAGASAGDVYVGDTGDSLVTKFDASGNVVSSWASGGQLDGSSTSAGSFASNGGLAGVAVDPSGNLWVYAKSDSLGSGFMYEFSQSGGLTGCAGSSCNAWDSGRGVTPTGIAVDSAGNVYVVVGAGNVEQFSASGTDIGDVTDDQTGGGTITGLAVDATSNDLYANDSGSVIRHYTAVAAAGCVAANSCTEADAFGTGSLTGAAGVAFDPSGSVVYAADSGDQRIDVFTPPVATTGGVSNVQGHSATVSGQVYPAVGSSATACQFEYGTDTGYGHTAPCSPAPPYSSPTTVSADLTGLTPGTLYHYRLDATSSAGQAQGQDQTFTTAGPIIAGEEGSGVSATAATLSAGINPQGADTTYHFEYGTAGPCSTSPCTRIPIPDADIGSPSSNQQVDQSIGGLSAATTYYFRVVAINAAGTSNGPDETFATTGVCPNDGLRYGYGAQLPDCRAYEQASPVDKDGTNPAGHPAMVQAASDGHAVTFLTNSGVPGGKGAQDYPVFLASRGAGGWSTQGLYPPASTGPYAEVTGWSGDLSEVFDFASPLQPPGTTFYLRDAGGSLTPIASVGSDGASFYFDAVSSDGSKVLFEETSFQLTPNAAAGQDNLYEWDRNTGALVLVGVLPDGSTPPGGSFAGSYDWFLHQTTSNGGAEDSYYTQDTISADGSRVLFTAAGSGQLYMRVNPLSATATTVRVSASQKTNGTGPGGTDPNGPQPAAFMDAAPDGSHVFFASPEELTNNANTGSADQGNDLYGYDAATGALSDLTPDSTDANGAQVLGVLGEGGGGSYVYFAANGVLAAGATPGNCVKSQPLSGTCNLYLWHDGTTRFIARLNANGQVGNLSPGSDMADWQPTVNTGTDRNEKTARVTPDGQTLLFASQAKLTGYDNHDNVELYRYSAPSGQLSCVSCDPTGRAPSGFASMQSFPPLSAPFNNPVAVTRNLSDSGNQVFFNSPDALVPGDTNGVQDVYEWEADGAGSCHSAAQDGGCLYLISSGQSADPSSFLDASASGSDVFLFTDQSLVGQDQDQLVDVYDARVDGGIAAQNPPPAPPPCSSASCRTPPPPPPLSTAASVTFSGPGNQTPASSTGKVRVLRRTVEGSRFVLSVRVPGEGRITITGSGVKTVRKSVSKAGSYGLTVTLTAAERRKLKRVKRLTLKVKVNYLPSSGSSSSATASVTVKRSSQRRRGLRR